MRGQRELLYYIGQGRRGRTYLFSVDGFAFEAPVNWYADRQMWDMPPAYSDTREIPMNLPALMSCLECHGSGIQPPVAGTENRYKLPIFSYPGVTCERCHVLVSAGGLDLTATRWIDTVPHDREELMAVRFPPLSCGHCFRNSSTREAASSFLPN